MLVSESALCAMQVGKQLNFHTQYHASR